MVCYGYFNMVWKNSEFWGWIFASKCKTHVLFDLISTSFFKVAVSNENSLQFRNSWILDEWKEHSINSPRQMVQLNGIQRRDKSVHGTIQRDLERCSSSQPPAITVKEWKAWSCNGVSFGMWQFDNCTGIRKGNDVMFWKWESANNTPDTHDSTKGSRPRPTTDNSNGFRVHIIL